MPGWQRRRLPLPGSQQTRAHDCPPAKRRTRRAQVADDDDRTAASTRWWPKSSTTTSAAPPRRRQQLQHRCQPLKQCNEALRNSLLAPRRAVATRHLSARRSRGRCKPSACGWAAATGRPPLSLTGCFFSAAWRSAHFATLVPAPRSFEPICTSSLPSARAAAGERASRTATRLLGGHRRTSSPRPPRTSCPRSSSLSPAATPHALDPPPALRAASADAERLGRTATLNGAASPPPEPRADEERRAREGSSPPVKRPRSARRSPPPSPCPVRYDGRRSAGARRAERRPHAASASAAHMPTAAQLGAATCRGQSVQEQHVFATAGARACRTQGGAAAAASARGRGDRFGTWEGAEPHRVPWPHARHAPTS